MANSNNQISTDRLFDASEAVLKAVKETAVITAGSKKARAPFPPDLMGRSNQPACLSDFTKHEVEQATAFLIRLGFYQGPLPKK
ncbi:MAG: hypothetical protein H7210_14260 [Pyrinomonadaceae bacterium]|nr:hypothetical protein [Phycisphaerales bacterium]